MILLPILFEIFFEQFRCNIMFGENTFQANIYAK